MHNNIVFILTSCIYIHLQAEQSVQEGRITTAKDYCYCSMACLNCAIAWIAVVVGTAISGIIIVTVLAAKN